MLKDSSKANLFSNGADTVSLVSGLTISFYALAAVIPMLSL